MSEYVPARKRKEQELAHIQSRIRNAAPGLDQRHTINHHSPQRPTHSADIGPRSHKSLIDQTVEMKRTQPQLSSEEQRLKEERELLDAIAARKALQSDRELAKGIEYSESLKTSWRLPRHLDNNPSEEELTQLRKKLLIDVEGEMITVIYHSY